MVSCIISFMVGCIVTLFAVSWLLKPMFEGLDQVTKSVETIIKGWK